MAAAAVITMTMTAVVEAMETLMAVAAAITVRVRQDHARQDRVPKTMPTKTVSAKTMSTETMPAKTVSATP